MPSFLKYLNHCNSTCQKKENQALARLYYSTGGEHWFNNSNWLNQTVSHCLWKGVLCYNNTGHVIALNLNRNNLNGVLGDALRGLDSLLGFCLGRNDIYGNLYSILSPIASHIMRVDLAYTRISGNFPGDVITRCPMLTKIQLSGNEDLTGKLPGDIGNVTTLQVISLGETKISGVIPESIGKLHNIWFLDFETLNMKGTLWLFKNMTKLRFLHLSSNKIHDSIPEDIGKWFPEMREILLQNNMLHGEIPHSISLMKNLAYFSIARNKQLHGLLPRAIGQLRYLKVLVISETNLEGFQPGFVFSSSNLALFSTYGNKRFSCTLTNLLHMLVPVQNSLMQLDMEGCNIQGKIPVDVFSFKKLTFLKLGSNNLSGVLPDPMDNVQFLTKLDLSHNNLEGPVPPSFTKLLMLLELDLRGNSKMKGKISQSYLWPDDSLMTKEKQTDFFSCPILRFRHNSGIVRVNSNYDSRRYCYCDEHFYGVGGFCHPCLPNAKCQSINGLNASSFVYGSIRTNMTISTGAWPLPSFNEVKSFVLCPSSLFHNNICNPAKNCVCSLQQTNDSVNMRYITRCNENCLCLEGHNGRFCSQCASEYYKDGVRCIKCPEGTHKIKQIGFIVGSVFCIVIITAIAIFVSGNRKKTALALVLAETVTIVVLSVLKIIPVWLVQATVLVIILAFGGHGRKCKGLFKIAVFYFQVMDALVLSVNIWPGTVYKAQSYFSSALNLHFSSIECYIPQFFATIGQMLLLLFLPPVMVSATWMIYGIWYLIIGKKNLHRALELKLKCRHYCLMFCDLAYFPIVKAIFSITVSCRTEEGQSFMRNYVWIDCHTTEHKTLLSIAGIGVPVYIIGVPICLYLPLLYLNREKVRNNDEDTNQWLGSLYLPYKEMYRTYMEVVLMMRRMIIAMALSVIPVEMPLQTTTVTIIFIVSIVGTSLGKPYANLGPKKKRNEKMKESIGLENSVEIATLSVMLFSFVVVRFLMSVATFSLSSPLVWLVVVANVLLLLILGLSTLIRLISPENVANDEQPLVT